eukprot:TRINITY_DN24827_c0_g1_i1.p2 TRINITY_DN24827_c0_g1~~TRINITY_DN24827_c0_g1_i1.p2  ORF type:complete len:157 (-),score=26.11 TRINITY_DN24827_c0_g1_i1:95-565(-)
MSQMPSQNMQDIKGDVAHRLEASGALDQIRVQIRASIFRALLGAQDAQPREDAGSRAPGESGCPPEAPLQLVSLVSDVLEVLDLGMTKEVFLRETAQRPLSRKELEQELAGAGLPPPVSSDEALLEQVLAAAQEQGSKKVSQSAPPETILEEEPCR